MCVVSVCTDCNTQLLTENEKSKELAKKLEDSGHKIRLLFCHLLVSVTNAYV